MRAHVPVTIRTLFMGCFIEAPVEHMGCPVRDDAGRAVRHARARPGFGLCGRTSDIRAPARVPCPDVPNLQGHKYIRSFHTYSAAVRVLLLQMLLEVNCVNCLISSVHWKNCSNCLMRLT
jgi:hypothetical protein